MENKVIDALGQHLGDANVEALISVLPEKPIIDDKPILHDDSDTISYEFPKTGVLLGFDFSRKLKYVYFYLLAKEGFQACELNILPNISKKTTKEEILKTFGVPNSRRKTKIPLLEFFDIKDNDWLLYDKGAYRLRFEFSDKTERLEEISYMLTGTVPGYDLKD